MAQLTEALDVAEKLREIETSAERDKARMQVRVGVRHTRAHARM